MTLHPRSHIELGQRHRFALLQSLSDKAYLVEPHDAVFGALHAFAVFVFYQFMLADLAEEYVGLRSQQVSEGGVGVVPLDLGGVDCTDSRRR
jgi:hypothetical protein